MSLDAQSDIDADILPLRKGCEERIGYVFKDRTLLHAALTHASGAEHRLASNERLEFLGDAILGAIVCERLFHQYPDYLEGDPYFRIHRESQNFDRCRRHFALVADIERKVEPMQAAVNRYR